MHSKGTWPLTHAAASDSATGLKNIPLASILKVEIPELHLLGRPPSKKSENEAAVNLGIGRAERAGHLRSCVAGRFFVSLARGIRELPRARAKNGTPAYVLHIFTRPLPRALGRNRRKRRKTSKPEPGGNCQRPFRLLTSAASLVSRTNTSRTHLPPKTRSASTHAHIHTQTTALRRWRAARKRQLRPSEAPSVEERGSPPSSCLSRSSQARLGRRTCDPSVGPSPSRGASRQRKKKITI